MRDHVCRSTIHFGRVPEPLGLFRREPIAESHPEFSGSLEASDAGGKVRTQQPTIGNLTGKPAHYAETGD